MRTLLIENLGQLQQFDANLRRGKGVEAIASRYFSSVMFEPDAEARRRTIGAMEGDLLELFRARVQPAAMDLGEAHARAIVARLGNPTRQDLDHAPTRNKVLYRLKARAEERAAVVKSILDDKGNTLDNRLTRYYLSPDSGLSAAERVAALRRTAAKMEGDRKRYEDAMDAYRAAGDGARRPTKPRLDYASRFTDDVKTDLRAEARRAGVDAQTAEFQRRGFSRFLWVAVGAGEACPDCKARGGRVMTLEEWRAMGLPGTGATRCGAYCWCMLTPAQALDHAPSLAAGIDTAAPSTPPAVEPAAGVAFGGPAFDPGADPHAVAPGWQDPPADWRKRSYGGVVLNDEGQVLLREPTNHFDGYHWTFPKGKLDSAAEPPHEAALREVAEETGYSTRVVGYVPGGHKGGTGTSYFYFMKAGTRDPSRMDAETASVRFVTIAEARELIGRSTNATGRARDLGILDAAERAMKGGRAPASARPKGPPPEFPAAADLSGLKDMRALGGSTGARLVEDEHGQKFVLKRGSSPDHLRSEFRAEEAYRALGADVPGSRLYEAAGGPVKLSKFVPGKLLGQTSGADRQRAIEQVNRHFAADALLGNWDVAGAGLDNILVGDDGKAYRIDTGGALSFRAQGAAKGAAWNDHPAELWSMADPAVNRDAAALFSGLTHRQKVDQIKQLLPKRESLLATLGPDATVVGRRLDELAHLAEASEPLFADRFHDAYVGEYARHTLGLRKDGIGAIMPSHLGSRSAVGDVTVKDEHGRPWDGLRGEGGHVAKVHAYVAAAGGKPEALVSWAGAQAGSSWSNKSMAFKAWLAERRAVAAEEYYWKGGHAASKAQLAKEYQKWGQKGYDTAFTAWHAYMGEFLRSVDFQQNDRVAGVVELIRTEGRDVLAMYGLRPGDQKPMKRGAAESFSLYARVSVFGDETTVQRVPHARVFGTYMHAKGPAGPEASMGMFLGDRENEIVAMTEGVSVWYNNNHRDPDPSAWTLPRGAAPRGPTTAAPAAPGPDGVFTVDLGGGF